MARKLNLTVTFRNVGVKKGDKMLSNIMPLLTKYKITSAGADISDFDIHELKRKETKKSYLHTNVNTTTIKRK